MSDQPPSQMNPDHPAIYQIRIKGHLHERWKGWFEGATITLQDNGETLIVCSVVDQAALHGLLRKVRDLAIPLLSVNPIEQNQTDTGDPQS